jgi:hypothetical protein
MNPVLRQLRDGVTAHIAEDPTVITPYRCALIDDGFGGFVRSGNAAAQAKARVRIQHESGGVQANGAKPAGLDTNLSLYILTDYHLPLLEGDTFSNLGFTWTVGPVNSFSRHGGIYKSEAPLVKGLAVPVSIPIAFIATAISDTAIDLTWSDTGAVDMYAVERRVGAGTFSIIGTVAATALVYHDTGLTPETAYTYRLSTIPSNYLAEDDATTEETPS